VADTAIGRWDLREMEEHVSTGHQWDVAKGGGFDFQRCTMRDEFASFSFLAVTIADPRSKAS